MGPSRSLCPLTSPILRRCLTAASRCGSPSYFTILLGRLLSACPSIVIRSQAVKKAAKEVGDLDGITTFCELAVPLASRLAEALGLPHNSVQAVDNARDKVSSGRES